MDKTKKILLVVFATLLVMNLQFNTPLTKGMNDGFSLSQLVENVFVQESYAEDGNQPYYLHEIICSCGNGHYSNGVSCRIPGGNVCSYIVHCFCD